MLIDLRDRANYIWAGLASFILSLGDFVASDLISSPPGYIVARCI